MKGNLDCVLRTELHWSHMWPKKNIQIRIAAVSLHQPGASLRTYGKANDSMQSARSAASPKYCCTNILCFLPSYIVLLYKSTENTCRDDRDLQNY